MDDGGDHRGASDCGSPATQGGHVVNNGSCSPCHRPADADLLRPRCVPSVDDRLGIVQWRAAVYRHPGEAVDVRVVADRRGRLDDARPAVLPPGTVHDRHHSLSRTISALQKKRKSVADSFMVALCNRADHIYFHAVVCSSTSFFPRLISAAADWMSAILPHMV